jgi:hypothetical protein
VRVRRGRGPGRAASRLVFVAVVVVVGACGASTASAPTGSAGASADAASPPASSAVQSAQASASPGTTATPGTSASAGPVAPASVPASGGAGVVRDDSLLAILPATVAGQPVIVEEDSFAEAVKDRAFASNVSRAAFAIATSPTDLASGVVAQLRPGVFGDRFFEDWRDTYNEGACAQAGGIVGNVESELGGRTVYITTCEGGIRVYHAWIPERTAIVSLFSIGTGRFGEELMGHLRP